MSSRAAAGPAAAAVAERHRADDDQRDSAKSSIAGGEPHYVISLRATAGVPCFMILSEVH